MLDEETLEDALQAREAFKQIDKVADYLPSETRNDYEVYCCLVSNVRKIKKILAKSLGEEIK